jgi:hypothetical protein
MNEEQRMSRMERGLRPEDLVERSFAKLKAWAQIPVLQDRMRTVASLQQ